MTISDRAFRALARFEPNVIATLLHVVAPDVVPASLALTPEDVAASQLDPLPPPLDVDWVARSSDAELFHVECQGYRDPGFVERLFYYHLRLVLQHPTRHVRSVAIWLRRPAERQRVSAYSRGDVTVKMTTVVLAEVPASELLVHAPAACFAPGAAAGDWSDAELCDRAAATLAANKATYHQRHMAAVAAMTRGRYEQLVKAMSDHNLEPVIIEDLVHFGEDRGLAAGLAAGRDEGLRALTLVIQRKLGHELSGDEQAGLLRRFESLGLVGISEAVLDLDGDELEAWLLA